MIATQPDTLTALLYSPQTYGVIAVLVVAAVGWLRWQKMSKQEKQQALTLSCLTVILCAASAYIGYSKGSEANNPKFRFLTYIDGQAIEVAKDMQAMCDQRQICKANEIQARWEDATGLGKIAAGLQ